MYTKLTPDDFRRQMGFPKGYTVEGLLISGTWDLLAQKRHIPYLQSALDKLKVEYKIKRFKGANNKHDSEITLGHAYEIAVGEKHYWFVPVVGTAVMSIYAHTASILGSKKNILIGMVGGLAKGMKSGDIILPKSIFGNDNALKYQPENTDKVFYPDNKLYDNLFRRIPKDTKLWEGRTVTCEVIFAETQDDVSTWANDGYLGVEMEGAMIFALSKYFQLPSAAIFSVVDNLIEEETLLHKTYELSKVHREKARSIQYDVAVQELLNYDKR